MKFEQDWYAIGTKIGFAQIDYAGQVPFIADKDDSHLIEIYADIYASHTLRASLGMEYRFDLPFAKAELEWLTPIDGLSLNANFMVGQNQYDHALVGLRYSFGGERGSLKGQGQTPRAMSSGVLYATGNYGALYNNRAKKFLAANQVSGNQVTEFSGSSGSYGVVNTMAVIDPELTAKWLLNLSSVPPRDIDIATLQRLINRASPPSLQSSMTAPDR